MDRSATDGAGPPAQSLEQASAAKSSDGAVAGTREEGESRSEWLGHPVDIRLTIPLPFRSFYVTIVAGPERRAKERRAGERKKHPLLTLGNLTVYLIAGSICGFAMLGLIQILFIEALSRENLLAGAVAGVFIITGFLACLWLLIRRPFAAARKAEGSPAPTATE